MLSESLFGVELTNEIDLSHGGNVLVEFLMTNQVLCRKLKNK